MRTCFGAFAEGIARGLQLRHDHGSQFVADDFQRELAFLGIEPSPAFVRTLKENLLWLRCFASIEELRQALHQFKDTCNHTWIIERHGYRTPAQVRADQLGLATAASTSMRCLKSVERYKLQPPGLRREPDQAVRRSPHEICA